MSACDRNAPCADCGVDTAPCLGVDGCGCTGGEGKWEWYMVRDGLWERVAAGARFLCVGCLEARLGRRLWPGDFAAYPVNDIEFQVGLATERLVERLGGS